MRELDIVEGDMSPHGGDSIPDHLVLLGLSLPPDSMSNEIDD